MPDLKSLGSLIHASPVYFAQYRLDRRSFLCRSLERDLGRDVLVDAYAAFKSRSSKIGTRTVTSRDVTDFIDLYGTWRHAGITVADLELMPLADLRWITWFHTLTVWPLADRFSKWALANLKYAVAVVIGAERLQPGSTASQVCGWPNGWSKTEQRRILRGFYRFEIFCHLFNGKQRQTFHPEHIGRIFFSQFEPWEVEEMDCVYTWIQQRYQEVVAEVKWDLHPNNPKFATDPDYEFEPEGAFTLDRDDDEYLNGTIGYGGLRLALHMSKTEGHDQLVDLMIKYLKRSQACFFQDCMHDVSQVERRGGVNGFGYKDRAEQRREAMPFVGDDDDVSEASATVSSNFVPPLAWVLLWDGMYCNLYGVYLPEEFRRWGYVMWDARRWNSMECAKEILTELWASSSQLKMAKEDWIWL
ncbi:hypothetical protein VM1G_10951 [Cytospora mali]|uniref:Uncharacterized protein n=1 Tax=Cytospora mali TaxID=578113 RepID=A0A194VJM8_CYTMA|nr:hypothetical protein VM1G_10951 [Valsa mali]